MSTFRAGERAPAWCQLQNFTSLDLDQGRCEEFVAGSRKERLIVASGTVQVCLDDGQRSLVLKPAQFLDLARGSRVRLIGCSTGIRVVRLVGEWGAELGGCGVFQVVNTDEPVNIGDPADYLKTTSVDVHYHDCDEYWIVLEGAGTVRVGDSRFRVTAGDCIPIGMGHHHDFPTVEVPVKAVFFETTLEGAKRVGHLWAHTHGPASPKEERV